MRPILTLLLPLLAAPLAAQITIGPSDMPSAGDTLRYRSTDATEVVLEVTGPDMLWDYSFLVPGAEGADTAVSVSSTPLLYQFYFNNGLLYPAYDADLALRGPAFGFQQLTVSDVYEYYKKDASGYRNVGFGANVNGIPTSVRRTPVDYIHRFPLEFGDEDSSFSSFTLNVPTLFSFTQDQLRINTVMVGVRSICLPIPSRWYASGPCFSARTPSTFRSSARASASPNRRRWSTNGSHKAWMCQCFK